ncbi:hypothetical protein CC86DRAFT_407701 [Ophiobolus disseminans]|uniref:Uncharacterized protein n=1 Tax=Ophiobolus disseminans TaxID=1469910 RepID=A0A6A6ZWU0_9PLEO|nr:hypothetical protein CC86DRAFT_407701 [Ophiobolus disseminans]
MAQDLPACQPSECTRRRTGALTATTTTSYSECPPLPASSPPTLPRKVEPRTSAPLSEATADSGLPCPVSSSSVEKDWEGPKKVESQALEDINDINERGNRTPETETTHVEKREAGMCFLRISKDPSNNQSPYSQGAIRMNATQTNPKESVGLATMISDELSVQARLQLEASRHHKLVKSLVGQELDRIIAQDRNIVVHHELSEERLQELLDDIENRQPLSEGKEEGLRRASEIEQAEELRTARQTWLNVVERVEGLQNKILVNYKHLNGRGDVDGNADIDDGFEKYERNRTDKIAVATLAAPTTTNNIRVPVEEDNAKDAQLMLRMCTARGALSKAREVHEEYRVTYNRRLNEYTCRRSGKCSVDIREEFTGEWLRGWSQVIEAVRNAEVVLKAVFNEAALAGMMADMPGKDDEPYTPSVEIWASEITREAEPDMPPAGEEESELEKKALEQQFDRDDAAGVDRGSCRNGHFLTNSNKTRATVGLLDDTRPAREVQTSSSALMVSLAASREDS